MSNNPDGAPRKYFNWDLLESLAILQADLKFVAERMIIEEKKELNKRSQEAKMKFINRRLKERFGFTYVQYKEEKREAKRIKLRQKMWDIAMKGNVPLLIFLSKQEEFLRYSDKVEQSHSGEVKTMTLSYSVPPKGIDNKPKDKKLSEQDEQHAVINEV